MRELKLKVVEMPTDPRLGLDPDGLEPVLERHNVAACLLIPNFHNPLGSLMPTERKARVMEILSAYRVPVIEDDVYGELYFGTHRPDLLRSHDRQGLVISCGSLSKVMVPGFRVGWALAEPTRARDLARLKAGFSIASPSLEQAVLVEFLKAGALDRFLRSLRTKVRHQVYQHVWAIRRHFPPVCRLAEPQGGNLLWVELPPQVDSMRVHTEAQAQGISLVPGPAFTSGQGFGNYLRMSCPRPLDDRLDNALKRLGGIIARLAGGAAEAFPATV
jgi:DNA-binding transcriptional MocR family regulator